MTEARCLKFDHASIYSATGHINFDELMKWQGLRFHATGLWQVGANLGAKIGTLARIIREGEEI